MKLIEDEMESSVKYHKIADVEVGAFLSGGLDSSYVVSTEPYTLCSLLRFP